MILLALLGCLDELLESPYVLAPGIGEARSVSARVDGRLLVATNTGVYAVNGEGRAERLGDSADAVAVSPTREYALRQGRVTWDGGALDVPGAIDLTVGYDGLVVLFPDAVEHVDPDTGARRRVPLPGVARAVSLGPDGTCLVVSETTLYRLGADDTLTPLATSLVDARAATIDAKGRVFVAQGAPEELWRVEPAGLVSVARWLGDPRDLQFGVGGLLPAENLYLANGAGTLDYVRPPP